MEDFERQSVASAELEHGEHLVWYGQPSGAVMAKSTWPVFIFAVPWTLFSLFWTGMALFITDGIESGVFGWLFPLFGLPFIGIGFWMLAAPFRAAQKAKRTIYAITNKRAVIITTGAVKKVQSFYPKDIKDIRRTEKTDGSGNLHFAAESLQPSRGGAYNQQSGFLGIPEVNMVELYLRDFLKPDQTK